MRNLQFVTAAAVLTLAALPSTGASAFPMPGLAGVPSGAIEQVRIVCDPFGRCFRIDAFGRRVWVPRREGFPGVGYGRPLGDRPGFPDGRGFGDQDGGGRPGSMRGDGGEGRRDPNEAQGHHRNNGDGQQQNAGGQRHKPDAAGDNEGGAQRSKQGGDQNRRRQPQQGDAEQ